MLPAQRDDEGKRLKNGTKVRLKCLPCFTVSGGIQATFLKTSIDLQETMFQSCLVVHAAFKAYIKIKKNKEQRNTRLDQRTRDSCVSLKSNQVQKTNSNLPSPLMASENHNEQ